LQTFLGSRADLSPLSPPQLFLDIDPEEADLAETEGGAGRGLVMSRQHASRDEALRTATRCLQSVAPIAVAVKRRLEEAQARATTAQPLISHLCLAHLILHPHPSALLILPTPKGTTKRRRVYEEYLLERWMQDARRPAQTATAAGAADASRAHQAALGAAAALYAPAAAPTYAQQQQMAAAYAAQQPARPQFAPAFAQRPAMPRVALQPSAPRPAQVTAAQHKAAIAQAQAHQQAQLAQHAMQRQAKAQGVRPSAPGARPAKASKTLDI